jgi:copper chaperone CopZ
METTNEKELLARIAILVTGVTCASCVRRVEWALSKKEGVAEASVNVGNEKASVSYEPTATSPEELVGVIDQHLGLLAWRQYPTSASVRMDRC